MEEDKSKCETTTKYQQHFNALAMCEILYSIRAKFYDRYNVRHDCDYSIEELIFDKLDELENKDNS